METATSSQSLATPYGYFMSGGVGAGDTPAIPNQSPPFCVYPAEPFGPPLIRVRPSDSAQASGPAGDRYSPPTEPAD